MEPIGNIKAQQISGPERTFSVDRPGDAQDRLRAGEKERQRARPGEQSPQVEESKIEKIADAMDNYVKSIQRDLDIEVHKDTGELIVKVISRESGEVIREIPSEELLKLAAKMEEMAGVLFSKSV
ncbi:MAG: flagellar protein FlaG [Desulfobacteraceae bacterium]